MMMMMMMMTLVILIIRVNSTSMAFFEISYNVCRTPLTVWCSIWHFCTCILFGTVYKFIRRQRESNFTLFVQHLLISLIIHTRTATFRTSVVFSFPTRGMWRISHNLASQVQLVLHVWRMIRISLIWRKNVFSKQCDLCIRDLNMGQSAKKYH